MTSPRKPPGAQNVFQSFGYALQGIFYALTRERNLRVHFVAGAFALFFSRFYVLTRAEYGLLVLSIGFVLACEMINTAIEKAVDLETSDYHRLAGIAKDVAAGAVLVSAVTSVAVGFLLFWDPPTLLVILRHILAHPIPYAIAILASLALLLLPRYPRL